MIVFKLLEPLHLNRAGTAITLRLNLELRLKLKNLLLFVIIFLANNLHRVTSGHHHRSRPTVLASHYQSISSLSITIIFQLTLMELATVIEQHSFVLFS